MMYSMISNVYTMVVILPPVFLLKRREGESKPKTGVPHFMDSIETNDGWL